ncbi:ATP-binding protein [uncultured Selenomonas sp.]|uniref:sensor histidine kinase n=1 Tax=uncultured Selenomonas sp. TaxID=159275 RepID=UPI00260053F9|nr:ATP-binding protein [uncultured Selenomonas sp.]
MLGSKIARRLFGSFLLLASACLLVLGLVLTSYFHDTAVRDEQKDLLVHANVLALALENGAYDAFHDIEAPIDRIRAQTGIRVTLIDAEGSVLVDSNRDAETMDNHAGRPEVQQALAAGYGTATRYSETLGANMLYVAIPWHAGGRTAGVVRTATSLAPIDAAMQRNLTVLAAALLAAFCAAALLAAWLARRQLAPLLAIIAAARALAQGDLARRIPLRTDDEYDILIRALNQLATSLERQIDAARTENEKLSLILDHMESGVLLFDENGDVVNTNRRIRKFFALKKSDLGRHSIHVLGSALPSETALEVLKEGAPKSLHMKLDVQGAEHTFKCSYAAFVAQGVPTVMAVLRDISLTEELKERQTAFVGNAAHELKTPLTSIRGFAELLAGDDFSDPETSHHCAAVIEKEAARMDRLIAGLLQLARLDDADVRDAIERTPIDAGRALQDAADELLPRAQKKQQQVDVRIETSATLLANRDLFGQILQNLIENAIKYTPAGGRIALSCTETEKSIKLTVADTGIGIGEADLPRIFDRFYRVDKARARASGGNGIGLSIVKFLVKLFDGKIKVESALGKGTCFTLKFPKVEG